MQSFLQLTKHNLRSSVAKMSDAELALEAVKMEGEMLGISHAVTYISSCRSPRVERLKEWLGIRTAQAEFALPLATFEVFIKDELMPIVQEEMNKRDGVTQH